MNQQETEESILVNHHDITDQQVKLSPGYEWIKKQNYRNVIEAKSRSKLGNFYSKRKDAPLSDDTFKIFHYYLDMEYNSFKKVLETVVKIRKIITASSRRLSRVTELVERMALFINEDFISIYYNIENGRHNNTKKIETISREKLEILYYEVMSTIERVFSFGSSASNMVSLGCIPHIVHLLKTCDCLDLKEQCNYVLGDIAEELVSFRDLILDEDVLPTILKQLEQNSNSITFMRSVSSCLLNLTKGKPCVSLNHAKMVMSALHILLFADDDQILCDACWALEKIMFFQDEGISLFIESGFITRIIPFLRSKSNSIVTPVLRIFAIISSGNDMETEYMLNAGLLREMPTLINSPRISIRKDALLTIANILGGDTQFKHVIDAGLVPLIIDSAKSNEIQIKSEAFISIMNICYCNDEESVKYLIGQGAITVLNEGVGLEPCRWHCLKSLLELVKTDKDIVSPQIEDWKLCEILESEKCSNEERKVIKEILQNLEIQSDDNEKE